MTTERALQGTIERIKRELAALGDLRPGTIGEHYNVCGTPNCRCKADPPRKHGPYHQISYTRKGKHRTEFLRTQDLSVVQAQIRTYERLRSLVEEWVDCSMELDRLRRHPDRRG